MKIGAVITARSTSSRYPRKHLGKLGGITMIEQIIKKLEYLKNLDHIILSTTTNTSDNELCRIAYEAGAEISRGPEHDLLVRDLHAIETFNLGAVLTISGDCPFVSNEYVQVLIDGLLAEAHPENYDSVGGFGNLAPMPGFVAGINLKSAYEKYEYLMDTYGHKYSYEQYWIAAKEEPDFLKPLIIDTSHITDPEVTPMKLSIDWNLERLFWNKVIKWLGYYPQTVEDFNKAFGGMTKL